MTIIPRVTKSFRTDLHSETRHVWQRQIRRLTQSALIEGVLLTTQRLQNTTIQHVQFLEDTLKTTTFMRHFTNLHQDSKTPNQSNYVSQSIHHPDAQYCKRSQAPKNLKSKNVQGHHDESSISTLPTIANSDFHNTNPHMQVVQRMSFQALDSASYHDQINLDDYTDPDHNVQPATSKPKNGTLEESIYSSLDLFKELEHFATDAKKLSVLYRRVGTDCILRCSLAIHFDPLEDGWTALEVANKIVKIVRRASSDQITIQQLDIRLYQERFRDGEPRRYERIFSFRLDNLNAPTTLPL